MWIVSLELKVSEFEIVDAVHFSRYPEFREWPGLAHHLLPQWLHVIPVHVRIAH